MTYQRRNLGVPVVFYPAKKRLRDARGNVKVHFDITDPRTHYAVIYSADTGIAELPGEMGINVINLVTDPDLPDIDEWAVFEWDGVMWNVAAPPREWRGASRHTHHWRMVGRRMEVTKESLMAEGVFNA